MKKWNYRFKLTFTGVSTIRRGRTPRDIHVAWGAAFAVVTSGVMRGVTDADQFGIGTITLDRAAIITVAVAEAPIRGKGW